MKKLFIPVIVLMAVPLLFLTVAKKLMPDCGVYHNTDPASMEVLAIGAFDKEGRDVFYDYDVSHWREVCMSAENSYIVYATALEGGNYGFRSSEMPFHIDKVLEGSKDIEKKDIDLHSSFIFDGGFYEYDVRERAAVSAHLKKYSYSEEEYPELMNTRATYYSPLNLPKPGHHYIMCVLEYAIADDLEPIYFLFSDYFDEKDASNEDLISPETPLLKYYSDNITLFYYPEDLDSYCRFKDELFAFYNYRIN